MAKCLLCMPTRVHPQYVVMVQACDPSTWEKEVQGHPQLPDKCEANLNYLIPCFKPKKQTTKNYHSGACMKAVTTISVVQVRGGDT